MAAAGQRANNQYTFEEDDVIPSSTSTSTQQLQPNFSFADDTQPILTVDSTTSASQQLQPQTQHTQNIQPAAVPASWATQMASTFTETDRYAYAIKSL